MAALNEAELRLVDACAEPVEIHRPGAELAAEGQARRPRVILTGWACRQRLLADGRRQIFDLLIPGDITGFSAAPEPLTYSLVAMTRLETSDGSRLREAAFDGAAHPGLAHVLAASPVVEQSRLLDHVVRLGRNTASERVAHLLLEMADRLAGAGLRDGPGFPFPPTQQVLADLLGLSMVHMNRTLQQLRREQLIEMKAGRAMLLDPSRLTALAGYIPAFSLA